MPTRLLLVTLACLAAGSSAGKADGIDAAQRAFVERYVAAVTSGEATNVTALYHAASRACINPGNRDYVDFMAAKELGYAPLLRGGYTLTSFKPIDANSAAASDLGGLFHNPVQPTDGFQIDAAVKGGSRSLTLARSVARDAGAWFIVIGCPTEKGLALFRERQAEAKRQLDHTAQLVGELPAPLRSELMDLLGQDHRVEAIRRYQSAASVDLTTAAQVIDALGKPPQ